MSDYDYDAAMDQLAEWDEEFRMEEWECKEREREEREEREWEEKHADIYSLYKEDPDANVRRTAALGDDAVNVVEASSWVTNENTGPVQSPDQTHELVVLGGLRPLCAGNKERMPADQTSHIEDENSDDRRSGEFRRDAENVVEASDLEIGKYTEQQSTESILQKIEQDAEQQINQTLPVTKSPSELVVAGILPADQLSQQKAPICAETCVTIMKHGADIFKQQTGRDMTYIEMRHAFG